MVDPKQPIDEGKFALALNQARAEFGLPLNLAILFNPELHPRDLKGQFRKTIKDLKVGESAELPDGTKVKSLDGGYSVQRKGSKVGKTVSAREAADEALTASAGADDDDRALGGRKPMKVEEAGEAIAQANDAGEPSTPYKGEPGPAKDEGDMQIEWEDTVREKLRERGEDPDEVEADVEGFGQDYAEYKDDPDGFVDAILDMDPITGATAADDDYEDVGADVNRAADLLAQGKKVKLDQPRSASTLLTELARRVNEAKEKGEQAPDFDLCKVTVRNTNLFCAESKGIPRIKMPQVKGVPTPGSKADGLEKNAKGEVDLAQQFRQSLEERGVQIEDTVQKASFLRASQIELNGAKVAGMTKAMEEGKIPDEAIFVSHDDYIVDGHHRWAAKVGIDLADNKLGDVEMPIARIDMDIIELLDESNRFATEWGIPQAGVTTEVPKDAPETSGDKSPEEAFDQVDEIAGHLDQLADANVNALEEDEDEAESYEASLEYFDPVSELGIDGVDWDGSTATTESGWKVHVNGPFDYDIESPSGQRKSWDESSADMDDPDQRPGVTTPGEGGDAATPQGVAYRLNKSIDAAFDDMSDDEWDPSVDEGIPDALVDAAFENVTVEMESLDVEGVTPIPESAGLVVGDSVVVLNDEPLEMRELQGDDAKDWATQALADAKGLLSDLKSDEDGARAQYKEQVKALQGFLKNAS